MSQLREVFLQKKKKFYFFLKLEYENIKKFELRRDWKR